MKKALAIILVTVLLLLAGGSVTAVTLLSLDKAEVVTKISFSVAEIDMLVGATEDLPLVKDRLDGDVKVVTSNSGILSIDEDGRLKAVDAMGNSVSRVYVTATNEIGEKAYLNVNVYQDVKSYVNTLGNGLYVVYSLYDRTEDSWRIAGFKSYETGDYVSAPLVEAEPGYFLTGDWYTTDEMKEEDKVTFQNLPINKSFAVYGEEYLKDGSAMAGGLIDLNVEYDASYGVYVVTGLKYDSLKYESITIPKTYTIEKEEGKTETVEIKGIADGAFFRGKISEDGTKIYNVGLQSLKKVDISHIEFIGNNAFKNCLLLETVVFNKDKAVTIANSAFDGTKITTGNN